MPVILKNVPLVAQQSSNTCWYAGAMMVAGFFEYGPRLGIPKLIVTNTAITPQNFVRLAKTEGLSPCPRPPSWSEDTLAALLVGRGPIRCAGYWYGPGHVVVLVGAAGGKVTIHDPDGGVRKTEPIGWFNRSWRRTSMAA
jgi:hypothetical protein